MAVAWFKRYTMTSRGRMKVVGQNILMARKDLQLSQAELAELIPCGQPALSLIESGHRAPSLDMLCSIAGALGGSPDKLLKGVR